MPLLLATFEDNTTKQLDGMLVDTAGVEHSTMRAQLNIAMAQANSNISFNNDDLQVIEELDAKVEERFTGREVRILTRVSRINFELYTLLRGPFTFGHRSVLAMAMILQQLPNCNLRTRHTLRTL